MRLFRVDIEQRRTRRATVAALHAEAAQASAGVLLRPGDRILRVTPLCEPGTDLGAEALRFLLDRETPGPRGAVMTVRDWIDRMAGTSRPDPMARATAEAVLSPCGLRLEPDALVVGSPSSVPALAWWCRGTPFDQGALHPALMALPGARRSVRTFAGIKSRAVAVPLGAALQPERMVA